MNGASQPQLSLERRVLAILASVLLHLVLLVIGSVAAAIAATSPDHHGLPAAPLLVTAVALVLAHAGLSGVWWARTSGPMHLRTVLALAAAAGMWAVLVLLLDETRHSGIRSGAWAACLLTQVLLAALLATVIEFIADRRAAAARSRFSIGFVLFWTTAVAIGLAGVGAWGARHGWKTADIAGWTYFKQLQAVGIAGSLLAAAVAASVRLPRRWPIRIVGCLAAVILFGAGSPAAFRLIFAGDVGAPDADIVWIFAGQGLFLVVALVPVELARHDASTAAPAQAHISN